MDQHIKSNMRQIETKYLKENRYSIHHYNNRSKWHVWTYLNSPRGNISYILITKHPSAQKSEYFVQWYQTGVSSFFFVMSLFNETFTTVIHLYKSCALLFQKLFLHFFESHGIASRNSSNTRSPISYVSFKINSMQSKTSDSWLQTQTWI